MREEIAPRGAADFVGAGTGKPFHGAAPTKKTAEHRFCRGNLAAEREGFEPPEPLGSTVFKTAAIDHSAIFPGTKVTPFFHSAKSSPACAPPSAGLKAGLRCPRRAKGFLFPEIFRIFALANNSFQNNFYSEDSTVRTYLKYAQNCWGAIPRIVPLLSL